MEKAVFGKIALISAGPEPGCTLIYTMQERSQLNTA